MNFSKESHVFQASSEHCVICNARTGEPTNAFSLPLIKPANSNFKEGQKELRRSPKPDINEEIELSLHLNKRNCYCSFCNKPLAKNGSYIRRIELVDADGNPCFKLVYVIRYRCTSCHHKFKNHPSRNISALNLLFNYQSRNQNINNTDILEAKAQTKQDTALKPIKACPCCNNRHNLCIHGHYYKKYLCFEENNAVIETIKVTRYFCPSCKHTFTCLPSKLMPFIRYQKKDFLALCKSMLAKEPGLKELFGIDKDKAQAIEQSLKLDKDDEIRLANIQAFKDIDSINLDIPSLYLGFCALVGWCKPLYLDNFLTEKQNPLHDHKSLKYQNPIIKTMRAIKQGFLNFVPLIPTQLCNSKANLKSIMASVKNILKSVGLTRLFIDTDKFLTWLINQNPEPKNDRGKPDGQKDYREAQSKPKSPP